MNVILYTSKSDKKVVNKSLTNDYTIDCKLKNDCSIINPSLYITSENTNIVDYNYAYIPTFKRYYYVENITFINNTIVMLDLKVDVLMSFKNSFLDLNAVIQRNENKYNVYMNDNDFVLLNKKRIIQKEFANGFTGTGVNILTVNGG